MQSAAALARVRAGRGSRRPYLRHGWSRLPIDWRELADRADLGLTEAQVRGAIRALEEAGFLDPRLVTSKPIGITNEAVKQKLGLAKFFSATYRLFKLDGLETACEDYGQAVVYKGSIADQPEAFELDGHHLIERGKVFPVCGNTWRMLADTRFQPHFDFIGDFSTHYGIFPDCGTSIPFAAGDAPNANGGGCC